MKFFPGASTEDMYDYLEPLLGQNFKFETMYQEKLARKQTYHFNIIERLDNGKATLSVKRLNKHLCSLEVDIFDNSKIGNERLDKKGLHLNPRGSGKIVIRFIKKIKNLQKII